MVHQDEPEEASEPLGVIFVFIFVELHALPHKCSALACKVSKLMCPTTESTFVQKEFLKLKSMASEVIVACEGLYDLLPPSLPQSSLVASLPSALGA